MKIKMLKWQFFIILLICCSVPAFGATRYVPADYSTIQAAINAASSGDVILVADGVYTGSGNNNIDFKGKGITLQSENGPENCVINVNYSGRGFYFHSGETSTSVLSGFTISNGLVNKYSTAKGNGGGIYCKNSSPTIKNCIIALCRAVQLYSIFYGQGGGIYLLNADPRIERCEILHNIALTGSGIYMISSNPDIINCVIANNAAVGNGGGMACFTNSDPSLTNSSVVNNTAISNGGGFKISDMGTKLTAKNSIIWGNSPNQIYKPSGSSATATVTYSDVQGGYSGTGNINLDPLFTYPDTGNYHLQNISPCRDTGTSTGGPVTDIDGDYRPFRDGFDIGADESLDPLPDSFAGSQDDVNDVLYTAYSGVANKKDNQMYKIMVEDILDLVEDQALDVIILDEYTLLKVPPMLLGATTTYEHTSYFGNFKVTINPEATTNGLTKFTANLTLDFNHQGFIGYPATHCTYTGVPGTVDFEASVTGYYEVDLLHPGFLKQFFLTSVVADAKDTLVAVYGNDYEPVTVSYDNWRVSLTVNYGQHDPEIPQNDPINVMLVPSYLPSPVTYETDNRDYNIGGSFTIDPNSSNPQKYTFISGFHYYQEQNGADIQVQMKGNLGVPGMSGVVEVDTLDTISIEEEGTFSSGAVKLYGIRTTDSATFNVDGSVEIQSDHLSPSTWTVESWQEGLNPL